MCILLKSDYAKFGVSNLFFSKVIEEKPLMGRFAAPPPPGTGRVTSSTCSFLYGTEIMNHPETVPSWFLFKLKLVQLM